MTVAKAQHKLKPSTSPERLTMTWFINPRKKIRQLSVRVERLPQPAWYRLKGENPAGFADSTGAVVYALDENETDRNTQLIVRTTDEAFAIMELMARFINERDALQIDPATGRKPFHYQSREIDRLDTGETSSIHVQFDNRDESASLWPSTSHHMSVPYTIFKIIRAAMSQCP